MGEIVIDLIMCLFMGWWCGSSGCERYLCDCWGKRCWGGFGCVLFDIYVRVIRVVGDMIYEYKYWVYMILLCDF